MKKYVGLAIALTLLFTGAAYADTGSYNSEQVYRMTEQIVIQVKHDAALQGYVYNYSGSLVKRVYGQMFAETGLRKNNLGGECQNLGNLHPSKGPRHGRPTFWTRKGQTCGTTEVVRSYDNLYDGIYDLVWFRYVTREGKMDAKNVCGYVKGGAFVSGKCMMTYKDGKQVERDGRKDYMAVIASHANDYKPSL